MAEEKKDKDNVQTSDSNVTITKEQFDKLVGMAQSVQSLTEKINSLENKSDESNIVEANGERKPAAMVEMRCINDSPIIDMEFVEEKEMRNGVEVITSVKAKCKTLDGKTHTIPYFNGSRESYENQKLMKFQLVDQVDGTGASSVKKNKVYTGDVLPEIIRTPGENPKFSGKMVKAYVEFHERTFTVLVDGKKHQLTENQLQYK